MYHSITFSDERRNTRNTWMSWHLIPTSRPVISSPPLKEKYVEIPGGDILDFTEGVRRYPLYGNRSGTVEFIVDNGTRRRVHPSNEDFDYESAYLSQVTYQSYTEYEYVRYSEWLDRLCCSITDYLAHGKLTAVLEDDLSHYYAGRWRLKECVSEGHWAKVVLAYELEPYKYRIHKSTEDWVWDTFNFNIDVMQKDIFDNIEIDGNEMFAFGKWRYIGRMPFKPDIYVDSDDGNGMRAMFYNAELGISAEANLSDGRNSEHGFIFSDMMGENAVILTLEGKGTVSIDFRSGGL